MMKITAVGGYKAVGRNMTGVSIEGETIAIDNGIRLDTLQMYDKEPESLKKRKIEDLIRMDVIPEAERLKNVTAQVISHGHLDHIGALPLNKPKVPIISTHYTTEIGRKEYKEGDFYSIDYGSEFEISKKTTVELVEITHSIPYSSLVVLHSPEGDVVYASDFRFDNNSMIGRPDYRRLKELGKGNVKALIVESTRSRETGKTPSESIVRGKLKDVTEFIDSGLIIATTFSTHIERIQSILDEVGKTDRIPLILGRSLLRNIELAQRFGLLDLPFNAKLLSTSKAISNALKEIKDRGDYFLLTTGHQGEPDSVLSKLVDGTYPFKPDKGDSALFCAGVIPSPINKASRYIVETKLKTLGVKIFNDIHVSGHASREDHRHLLNLLKPDHIIPCHGNIDMRSSYAALAAEEGYEMNKGIHLLMNGNSIKL
jgi:ribonuclease J